MSYPSEYEKAKAEAMYAQTPNVLGATAPAPSSYYGDSTTQGNLAGAEWRPSPAEQAEKNYIHHSEQAAKASTAYTFLRQNPAFDEFIKLIRSGAIQI